MEMGDLYLRVGPRERNRGCPLTFRWVDSDGQQEIVVPPLMIAVGDVQNFLQAVASHVKKYHAVPPRTLLLNVRPADLYQVDWEAVIRGDRHLATLNIARFADRSDKWIAIPFELPARILRAGDTSAFDATKAERRYFRLMRLYGASNEELTSALQRGRFEIAHITASECFLEDNPKDNELYIGTRLRKLKPIKASKLLRLLKASRVRFLILECRFDPKRRPDDYAALLGIAHCLQAAGGPTTAVFEEIDDGGGVEELYMDIVHDSSLDRAVWNAGMSAKRSALFVAIGGASVLSITPMAERLRALARRTKKTLEALGKRQPVEGLLLHLEDTSVIDRIYNTDHESGAWVPMAEDGQKLAEIGARLRAARLKYERVLNVGLWREGAPLSLRDKIMTGNTYEVVVNVGQIQSWTLVEEKDVRPIPESALKDHYLDEGIPLRVVVSAKGFRPEVIEHTLLLPPPPRGSTPLHINVQAPRESGRYRIRVGLYHENNLLQSVLLRVRVSSQSERQRGPAIEAEVEFALMESFVDPLRLPGRTVNILCNANHDGTHTFQIVGTGFKKTFDFGEGTMRTAVDSARETLIDLAADCSSGEPKYRFDENNIGPYDQFERGLLQLAERGYELF